MLTVILGLYQILSPQTWRMLVGFLAKKKSCLIWIAAYLQWPQLAILTDLYTKNMSRPLCVDILNMNEWIWLWFVLRTKWFNLKLVSSCSSIPHCKSSTCRNQYFQLYTIEVGGTKRVVVSGYNTLHHLLVKNSEYINSRSAKAMPDRMVKSVAKTPGQVKQTDLHPK